MWDFFKDALTVSSPLPCYFDCHFSQHFFGFVFVLSLFWFILSDQIACGYIFPLNCFLIHSINILTKCIWWEIMKNAIGTEET
jgi:hypothetical protein